MKKISDASEPLKNVVLCHRAVHCYKNADCRGHDLHNLRKDYSIAPQQLPHFS